MHHSFCEIVSLKRGWFRIPQLGTPFANDSQLRELQNERTLRDEFQGT